MALQDDPSPIMADFYLKSAIPPAVAEVVPILRMADFGRNSAIPASRLTLRR